MNNIELENLKKECKKLLGDEEKAEKIGKMNENELKKFKNEITRIRKIKEKHEKSNKDLREKKLIQRRIKELLEQRRINKDSAPFSPEDNKTPSKPDIVYDRSQPKKKKKKKKKKSYKSLINPPLRRITIVDRKPRILFLADVKGWAWWIKSEYLKKYLSDEFDIDIKCILGPGCTGYSVPKGYDLYFTYGFSYINAITPFDISRRVTGVTAHRPTNVILPKMKKAGHLHANSRMLERELYDMGFNRVYYVPNGVDEELFKPVTPIPKNRKILHVGHVGKECPVKGQKEYIYPAIKKTDSKSVTNVKTWQDKIPHNQMWKIYQDMDVFIVASMEDGTPNPALEAASCGRPIISNRIGNMPEFIKDGVNGFLVKRNVGEYVKKINILKNDRELLIEMGKNARKTIEQEWTWKKQSENYRTMFREIFNIEHKETEVTNV